MVEKLTSCQVCMKSALNKVILFQKKVSKTEYSDFLGLLFDKRCHDLSSLSKSLGTYLASTAAREAPTAALSLSARSYNNLKLSPDFNPQPPDTITLAAVNSGLSDLVNSCFNARAHFYYSHKHHAAFGQWAADTWQRYPWRNCVSPNYPQLAVAADNRVF